MPQKDNHTHLTGDIWYQRGKWITYSHACRKFDLHPGILSTMFIVSAEERTITNKLNISCGLCHYTPNYEELLICVIIHLYAQ